MSDKPDLQQLFGTDDEGDEYPMSQDDSSKLGGSAPRRALPKPKRTAIRDWKSRI